jgi:hypothetical protein
MGCPGQSNKNKEACEKAALRQGRSTRKQCHPKAFFRIDGRPPALRNVRDDRRKRESPHPHNPRVGHPGRPPFHLSGYRVNQDSEGAVLCEACATVWYYFVDDPRDYSRSQLNG